MARLRGLYGALTLAQLPRIARAVLPSAPVFCFHNVVSDLEAGPGDRSLHMPVSAFAAVMEWIVSAYEVVDLSEIVRRAGSGRSLGGLAALTFDDAYVGVVRHALPLLAERRLPATLFMVPAFAERPMPTWWDRMATAGLLTDTARHRALTLHKGLGRDVLSDLPAEAAQVEMPSSYLPADWDLLLSVVGSGVCLESHTARHANLMALAGGELEAELTDPRRAIEARTGREPEAIAYPYGLVDGRVRRAAGEAGYRSGFTLEPRPMGGRRLDPLALPRVNVPAGISPEALECWAAGLNPNRWT